MESKHKPASFEPEWITKEELAAFEAFMEVAGDDAPEHFIKAGESLRKKLTESVEALPKEAADEEAFQIELDKKFSNFAKAFVEFNNHIYQFCNNNPQYQTNWRIAMLQGSVALMDPLMKRLAEMICYSMHDHEGEEREYDVAKAIKEAIERLSGGQKRVHIVDTRGLDSNN